MVDSSAPEAETTPQRRSRKLTERHHSRTCRRAALVGAPIVRRCTLVFPDRLWIRPHDHVEALPAAGIPTVTSAVDLPTASRRHAGSEVPHAAGKPVRGVLVRTEAASTTSKAGVFVR